MITPAEINRRNRAFWEVQSRRARPLIAQPIVIEQVIEELASEQRKGLSVGLQRTFDEILTRYGDFRREVLSEQARAGRRARKPDALRALIEEIVERLPTITRNELLERLRERAPGPVIEEIEPDTIHFLGPTGQSKSAPLSGLKDRLSRAKTTLRNRAKR